MGADCCRGRAVGRGARSCATGRAIAATGSRPARREGQRSRAAARRQRLLCLRMRQRGVPGGAEPARVGPAAQAIGARHAHADRRGRRQHAAAPGQMRDEIALAKRRPAIGPPEDGDDAAEGEEGGGGFGWREGVGFGHGVLRMGWGTHKILWLGRCRTEGGVFLSIVCIEALIACGCPSKTPKFIP